ncbi:hypothetical protein L6164_000965 [Bauhinia variegata]|uniref:Uncharacterized protein n=1 Tax=Bauhinia variegata TaxID=167791 RepID=A0ACB9QAB0_BAUVA|nr:hypothetical protein L6164_000965 [Bauhinia variegata]
MAKAGNLVSSKTLNSVFNPCCHQKNLYPPKPNSLKFHNNSDSSRRKDIAPAPLIGKNTSRASRRLITISTGDGRWHGNWTCDYLMSLRDLQLEDLVEVESDRDKNARVLVKLSIEKHASFGYSVDGRIMTSFTRRCSTCSSPYCRQIDTKFKVWVLLASRDNGKIHLPEIGDDPSVIYVKPGYEADLDSLVQDTIRLTTPVKDTCSELCEKSEVIVQYNAGKNKASIDKRWSKLLELKKTQGSKEKEK